MTSLGAQIRCWLPVFSALAAITVGVAAAIVPTSVLAEAQIRGTVEAVSVETKNSSLKEVLAALSDAFDVHYRSATNLERQINGTYTGSLEKVLKRVLEGYSFFVKTGDGGIELTVLESSNAAPAIEASPSFEIVGRPAGPTPAEVSPEVAVVTPSAPSASPAVQSIPSSPEPRGHLRAPSAKAPRPKLTRRIKIASSSWRKRSSRGRHTSLAFSSIFVVSRTSAFATTGIPTRWYPWLARGASCCAVRFPSYPRSLRVWRTAATK